MEATDLELLERHAPIARFNEGEYFLPASVEAFVARAELWERTGPSTRRLVAPAGTLDLDRLVELTGGQLARHYLRLVADKIPRAELVAWRVRRDRPRFRAETRLGRVGVLARFVDAGSKLSLLARGRVPTGAETAAALLDRDRPDHGEHPYYGRVVRTAGYLVLQYWYFSFFNDWRSRAHGVNDHEGDWEQVTIFLTEQPGTSEPVWVAFSAHDEVGADLRRRWDDPDLTVVDGHPVVHPGLGSHAGAYLAGEYLISVRGTRFARVARVGRRVSRVMLPWTRGEDDADGIGVPYVEYSRGDGVRIGVGEERRWRPVVIGDETGWVWAYTGLWGDDTNDPFGGERGPAGPRYERDGTVRASWRDPVGWASLDAVVSGGPERAEVIAERIAELDDELTTIATEQDRLRRRLRASVIGGATDVADAEMELTELAHRRVVRDDERHRLVEQIDRDVVVAHPHAHLRHRNVPLPTETGGRRRWLTVWATLSTPLVFGLLALMLLPSDRSVASAVGLGLVAVFALEAVARGRLLAFGLSVAALVVAFVVGLAVTTALLTSWRLTIAVIFAVFALTFLVLNLRELRRT